MTDPFQVLPAFVQLESLLAAIPDAALLLDLDKTVLAANSRFQRKFTGGRRIDGQPCHVVCHGCPDPCWSEGEGCPFDECRDRREPVTALHVHRTRNNEELTELTMHPLLDPEGSVNGVLQILHTIDFASARATRAPQLHGRSAVFRSMLREIQQSASTDRSVLIVGENGTGKELTARTLHNLALGPDRPFVPLDCSALLDRQFEIELFGHQAGAFPGAEMPRQGLISAAEGGTLFLKEIDALSPAMQARLLRVLETGQFVPVGATRPISCRFRLLCSSETDLGQAAQEGTFRADLRLLIADSPIRVPPLRERLEDLPVLVGGILLQQSCPSQCREVQSETIARLDQYSFPGNLRELRTVIERACLNAQGGPILPSHLPAEILEHGSECEPDGRLRFDGDVLPLNQAERLYIRWAGRTLSCDRGTLAKRLEISERTLYRRLRELACDGSDNPDSPSSTERSTLRQEH